MTGPTEEGSIVARIKADSSEFDAEMDRADGRVDKFTGKSATVKVKAQVDEALAKLAAVEKATNDVAKADLKAAAAGRASENAASSSYLANLRLSEALNKRGRSQLSVEVATEASARADRNAAAAESRHLAATLALTAAQERLKLVNEALAAPSAPDSSAGKTPAGNKSAPAAGPAGMMMAAVIAVATLIPMLGPLAGAFAATSGAIAGMGAAGVLAVLGIKKAMADGTAQGNVFAGGLHLLKGDLDQLSNTAATAMLAHFQVALSTINAGMPGLNQEIGTFSGMLGTAGNIVLSTLISGFKILLPLFGQAGVYVEQLAVGFQKWTTDGGLAKFASDASRDLPLVNQALGSLVGGVVHLIGALQPLGQVMLQVVNAAGALLTGIAFLGPGLVPIAAGALAAFGAFKLWAVLVPLIEKVATAINVVTGSTVALGVATEVASGPIGWVVAGLAAIAAIAGVAYTSLGDMTQATIDYSSAVQADSGVIGDNVKAQAAKALADSGAISNAKQLGISAQTLLAASLGNKIATDSVNASLDVQSKKLADIPKDVQGAAGAGLRMTAAQKELAGSIQIVSGSMATQQKSIKTSIKAYNEIADAQGFATIKTKAQLQAQIDLAKAYGESLPVLTAARTATKAAADQLAQNTANTIDATIHAGFLGSANSTAATSFAIVAQQVGVAVDAAKTWKTELDTLNGVQQTLEQTNIALAGDYQTMTTQITANIKSMGRAQADSLDITTAGGLANHQIIYQTIQDAKAKAAALVAADEKAGKSARVANNDSVTFLQQQRDALIKHATDAGIDAGAVTALVDSELTIPPYILSKIELQADAAEATLKRLLALWAKIPASQMTVVGPLVTPASNSAALLFGHADGATIGGSGGSTQDNQIRRLSVGEEVIRTSRANPFRPMLKAINNGSSEDIRNEARALAGPTLGGNTYNLPTQIIVQSDPQAALADQQRRLKLRFS